MPGMISRKEIASGAGGNPEKLARAARGKVDTGGRWAEPTLGIQRMGVVNGSSGLQPRICPRPPGQIEFRLNTLEYFAHLSPSSLRIYCARTWQRACRISGHVGTLLCYFDDCDGMTAVDDSRYLLPCLKLARKGSTLLAMHHPQMQSQGVSSEGLCEGRRRSLPQCLHPVGIKEEAGKGGMKEVEVRRDLEEGSAGGGGDGESGLSGGAHRPRPQPPRLHRPRRPDQRHLTMSLLYAK